MNNFNNVFLIIRKHCGDKGGIEGNGIFDHIARETGIPAAKLMFLLNTLQDLQLIKYSAEENYIKLTNFGKKQERLFTENS